MTTRFVQGDKIAEGASAEIYRGTLAGTLGVGRTVAIKRLRPDVCHDGGVVDRFLAEARLAVQLRHPHVVHAMELGEDAQGYYLLCEWNDGASLAQLVVAGGALGTPAILHIGLCICDALAYLHELVDGDGALRPIVHRDVTPANILIASHGQVRLGDFGVACAARLETMTHVQTQDYVPPGKVPLDAPCPGDDLYALSQSLLTAGGELPQHLATLLCGSLASETARSSVRARDFADALRAAAGADGVAPDSHELNQRVALHRGWTARSPALDAALARMLPAEAARPERRASVLRRGVPHGRPWILAAGVLLALALGSGIWLAKQQELPPRVPTHRESARLVPPGSGSSVVSAAAPLPATVSPPPARRKVQVVQLDLNTVPWSEVWVDGRRVGTTPLLGLRLTAGEHRFRLTHAPSSLTRELELRLSADTHQRLIIDLRSGAVQLGAASGAVAGNE